MRKKRNPADRGRLEAADPPLFEDNLEEAAELLSQQEPPAPQTLPPRMEDTDPLMIDPAD
jgi:hypothetical protein